VNIVVIGDALLDCDVDARATRLAPDAPVPVLSDPRIGVRPGGAALAAWMLADDGHAVELVTTIGKDRAGAELEDLLRRVGVAVHNVARRASTPQKVRLRANEQCVARVDAGEHRGVLSLRALNAAARRVTQARAVLVADYGRGIASHPALREALRPGREQIVVWDPHPNGSEPAAGVQLATPNAREAAAALERAYSPARSSRDAGMHAVALRERWRAAAVAVTCGSLGAFVAYGDDVPLAVPVDRPARGDACGAGDRFASAALVALASGALPTEAVIRAVDVARDFVRDDGLTRATTAVRGGHRPDAAREIVVATSGCFDLLHAGHVSALRAARSLGDRLVVLLNSDASVQRLKGPGRPIVPVADRAAVLRGLTYVDDVVVFDEDTPIRALQRLRPAIFAKGGDYDASALPETEVMARWGGRTVIVPYMEGRSTSRLVEEVSHETA